MEREANPPPQKVERKLVTILASDFVSYSAHMGRDEEATARVLKAHRSVIDAIIAFRDGRIFDTAGDSVLAEFASPVQAVRAALEIQEALQTRNESLDPAARMVMRIGINLGDVIVEDGDLIGDAINVAARLESMAKPGGIMVSGPVHDHVAGKVDWGFSDLGTPPLKNISRPIRVLEVSRGSAPAAASAPVKPAVSRMPLIAASAAIVVAAAGFIWWFARTPSALVNPPAPVAVPAAANTPAGAPTPTAGAQRPGPVPAAAYLTEEPPIGKLGEGVRVLVDDRTCPDGEIKEVIGGNFFWPDGTKKKDGVARIRRCIPR